MGLSDGLFGVVMLLVMYALCFGAIRVGRWWMDYLDRRDAAAFREQVMLVEAEIARRGAPEGCAYCGCSLDPTELCTRCANGLRQWESSRG